MNYVINAVILIALILVVEKAIIVHAKMYLSTALNADDNVPDPPLLRPTWRLGVYAIYVLAGVIALEGMVPRTVGIAVIATPVLLMSAVDVVVVRRILVDHKRDKERR